MSGHIENKISKSKEALLRSCVQMLSTRSWDEISIDDIEKHIHKTRGAIFHHYKTKDELLTNAMIYFSNIIHCARDREPMTVTMVRTLKEEFEVEYPEEAFFNLMAQALLKKIDEISMLFRNISDEYINQEECVLGKILFQIIIRNNSYNYKNNISK